MESMILENVSNTVIRTMKEDGVTGPDFGLALLLLAICMKSKDFFKEENLFLKEESIKEDISAAVFLIEVIVYKIDYEQAEIAHKPYPKVFARAYNPFERLIMDTMSNRALFTIITAYQTLLSNQDNTDEPEIFDHVLQAIDIFNKIPILTNDGLVQIVAAVANNQAYKAVYNPFAGYASYASSIADQANYLGQEFDEKTWAIGLTRLMIQNKWPGRNCDLRNDHSLLRWPEEKFDLIISEPPFDLKIRGIYTELISSLSGAPFKTVEEFFIDRSLNSLTPNGRIIAILPVSYLFSNILLDHRRYLIENDLIESVTLFPKGIKLNTNIPIVLLVINKAKKHTGKVKMIDATTLAISDGRRQPTIMTEEVLTLIGQDEFNDSEFGKFETIEAIAQNNFNLIVTRYLTAEKYTGTPLNTLLSGVANTRYNTEKSGKLVGIQQLKDSPSDYLLQLNVLEEQDITRNYSKIVESCLLIARMGNSLKPTYFEYTGTPVFVRIDAVLALKVDETKCNLTYLIQSLYSTEVLEQADIFRIGSISSRIAWDDLLAILIKLPTLKEQNRIVQQNLSLIAANKEKELQLFNKIHGLEDELFVQNAFLRHSLTGPTSNLISAVENLDKILREQILPIHPSLLSLRLNENAPFDLERYLHILKRDTDKIKTIVAQQLDQTFVNNNLLTSIDILDYLNVYTTERINQNLNYDILYENDKFDELNENGEINEVLLNANIELLDALFNNILDNAVKHAFTNFNGKKLIKIAVNYGDREQGANELKITVSNTGNPFPNGFGKTEFIRKGARASEQPGDGFGGWHIHEILRKINGDFEITNLDESADTFNEEITQFDIYLPIN